ncbi:MAG: hypothetical protein QOG15_587 [Solirubrobacteraceae bacterium]|jgi:hypothetical protein|nr:hypothetical protein [Solirubrobacteraceae bacterium]
MKSGVTALLAALVVAVVLAPSGAAARSGATARAACVQANNIEAIIDDSGSMSFTDPNALRSSGLKLFIDLNQAKALGAVEFGSPPAATIFKPMATGAPGVSSAMKAALDARIQADNGGTDYDSGFIQSYVDNPYATARIFLTDGANNGDFNNRHLLAPPGKAPPPIYVVGLGIGAAGTSADAARLQAIATQTGGRYFPNVQLATAQSVFNSITQLLDCRPLPKTFTSKVFVKKGATQTKSLPVSASAKKLGLVLNWAQPANRFTFSAIKALGTHGRVISTLSGKGKPGKLKVKKISGKTFSALTITKPTGTKKLKVSVKASKLSAGEITVTQLTVRGG